MIHTKKILTMIALGVISLNSFAADDVNLETLLDEAVSEATTTQVKSTNIVMVEAIDSQTLTVTLSNALDGISDTSEAKILEDVQVVSATKKMDDAKKIHLVLDADLISGKNYSIISVSEWLDTSIDFQFAGNTSKIENTLLTSEVWIEYISVVDNRNIEMYLNQELDTDRFDFKVFKEINSESVFLDTTNVNIKLASPLNSHEDYILILNLKDAQNKDIEVENSLYDFITGEFVSVMEVPVVEVSVDNTMKTSDQPIEEVAMNLTQTPDTGAKTNILLFLTFILTLSIFLARRKSFKM